MAHLNEMAKQRRRTEILGRHVDAALGLRKRKRSYHTSYMRAFQSGRHVLAETGTPVMVEVSGSRPGLGLGWHGL
jgi:hypothetical protein